MGMMDMFNPVRAVRKVGQQVQKLPGVRQTTGQMNQMAGGAAQGIGPSSPGMQKMMPPGLQKQMPQQFPMMKPNLAQYAQQGEAAGNNMDWMKQPAPEFMGGGPMDPSPNGMKELIQRMKTRNTGINGGRSPIQTDPRFQF